MKITETRTGKITITFEKKEDCIRKGDMITDGHILLSIPEMAADGIKLVLKNEKANRALILDQDFAARCGVYTEGCDIDFSPVVNNMDDHDTLLFSTGLTDTTHPAIPVELYHTGGVVGGLVGISAVYKPLITSYGIKTNSKNHDSWNNRPLSIQSWGGALLAVVMPCNVEGTKEIDAITAVHTRTRE